MFSGGFMKRILLFLFMFLLVVSFIGSVFGQDSEGEDEKSEPKVFRLGDILVKDKREYTGKATIVDGKSVEQSTSTDLVNLINQKVPSFYTGNNRVMGFGVAS